MLKKLYKHEFCSLLRTLLPIYGALIGFAAINRLLLPFESESTLLNTAQGFTVSFYVISIIAMFVVGFVIVILRFYKNLLSDEGYLTFSLPVSATKHITCKLICGFTVTVINFVAMLLSLLILGIGTDFMKEAFKALAEAIKYVTEYIDTFSLILIIAELFVMIVLSSLQGILMFYASMAIGQQFKNKVFGSAVAYVCIYAIVEVITAMVTTPVIAVNALEIEKFMESGIEAFRIFLLLPMVLSAVIGTAYFLITRYFLSKKLNLE